MEIQVAYFLTWYQSSRFKVFLFTLDAAAHPSLNRSVSSRSVSLWIGLPYLLCFSITPTTYSLVRWGEEFIISFLGNFQTATRSSFTCSPPVKTHRRLPT